MMITLEGTDPFIAGIAPGLADFFFGPLVFHVSLTDDADRVLSIPGVGDWWQRLQAVEPFARTTPEPG